MDPRLRLHHLDDCRHAAETRLHAGGQVMATSTLTHEPTLTAVLDHLEPGGTDHEIRAWSACPMLQLVPPASC
uniref:hypothetical protein n=1 Tax=Streptomyces chartreusis TaxID=1969 RepID=UPI003F493FD6